MPKVTVQDLFAEIGRLTMEKKALEAELATYRLLAEAFEDRKEDDDVQSEVPSPVSGPDNDTGLV